MNDLIPAPLTVRQQYEKFKRTKKIFLSNDVYSLNVWRKLRETEKEFVRRVKKEDEESFKPKSGG